MQTPENELGLIVGAKNLALFLGFVDDEGRPLVRRIYHLAEKKSLPIRKHPGLGLVASKKALRKHFAELEEPVE